MKASSLAQAIVESAKQHPEKIAIKIKNETLTYSELLCKSSQVASALKEQGANKEAIGVVGQRHMASYVGILGILLAGCYYVPVNPKLSKDKIISIVNDSNIKLLVGDVDSFSKIKQSLIDNNCKTIITKITPFELAPESSGWLDKKYIDSKSFEINISNISKGDLAYVMYTSGSTGNPKGVQVTNANVLSWLKNMSQLYSLKPGFIASQTYDLSFDLSVSDIFHTWFNSGVLCVLPEDEHLYPVEFINRESIELWSSVPTLLNFMSKMGALKENIFPSIRFSLFCGEPFPVSLAEKWSAACPNSSVENLYGPTEATIWMTRYEFDRQKIKVGRNGILPIGTPFSGHRVEIILKDNKPAPMGGVGELVYKGPQITKGYINDEDKTNSVFVKFDWDDSDDIWYKSGDLGFLNKSGYFECIGRKDNQIKLGGRRIEIGEIESVLSKFTLLQDVVVVPIKDESQITTGCIAYTMSEINKEEKMRIQQESMQNLEQVFFPKKIVTIDEFPRTTSGKIDRKALSLKAQNL